MLFLLSANPQRLVNPLFYLPGPGHLFQERNLDDFPGFPLEHLVTSHENHPFGRCFLPEQLSTWLSGAVTPLATMTSHMVPILTAQYPFTEEGGVNQIYDCSFSPSNLFVCNSSSGMFDPPFFGHFPESPLLVLQPLAEAQDPHPTRYKQFL